MSAISRISSDKSCLVDTPGCSALTGPGSIRTAHTKASEWVRRSIRRRMRQRIGLCDAAAALRKENRESTARKRKLFNGGI